MKLKKALIDADLLTYEYASLKEEETGDPIKEEDLKALVDWRLNAIVSGAGCVSRTLYLTGKGNFREEIATMQPYKGQRKRDERPYHYGFLRELFIAEYGAIVVDGYEADDAIAMDHTLYPDTTVICTRDKDLRQVPGWHYGWSCGRQPEFPVQKISKWEGDKAFYSQLLTGDKSDNIKGLSGTKDKPGIGPAQAKKILASATTEEELYEACKLQYQKRYGLRWFPYLYETACLLYMLRHEGDSWEPPKLN